MLYIAISLLCLLSNYKQMEADTKYEKPLNNFVYFLAGKGENG